MVQPFIGTINKAFDKLHLSFNWASYKAPTSLRWSPWCSRACSGNCTEPRRLGWLASVKNWWGHGWWMWFMVLLQNEHVLTSLNYMFELGEPTTSSCNHSEDRWLRIGGLSDVLLSGLVHGLLCDSERTTKTWPIKVMEPVRVLNYVLKKIQIWISLNIYFYKLWDNLRIWSKSCMEHNKFHMMGFFRRS